MSLRAPFLKTAEKTVGNAATAANLTTIAARAPFAGTVSKISYIPNATITGQNTNTRKVALVNKGQSGSGNLETASIQFNSGVNAAAFDETSLTLSGTAANLVVAEGDVLTVESTAVGTGLADPGGLVFVEFSRALS